MSDLSSVQTTSFRTRLSFLDEESDESLFEENEEEDDGMYGGKWNTTLSSNKKATNNHFCCCLLLFFCQRVPRMGLISTSCSSSRAPPLSPTFPPSREDCNTSSVPSTPQRTFCRLWPRFRVWMNSVSFPENKWKYLNHKAGLKC